MEKAFDRRQSRQKLDRATSVFSDEDRELAFANIKKAGDHCLAFAADQRQKAPR
jgi:hypothetical protein